MATVTWWDIWCWWCRLRGHCPVCRVSHRQEIAILRILDAMRREALGSDRWSELEGRQLYMDLRDDLGTSVRPTSVDLSLEHLVRVGLVAERHIPGLYRRYYRRTEATWNGVCPWIKRWTSVSWTTG